MYLTMKAIFWVVMSSAAIIRSPSFSRSVESSTTMKSPLPMACMVSQCMYLALCPDVQLNLVEALKLKNKRAITVRDWVTHGTLQWCLLYCRSATSTPHLQASGSDQVEQFSGIAALFLQSVINELQVVYASAEARSSKV